MKQPRPRASHSQRSAVMKVLDQAFSEGKLDHFEHFERTRTATKAKFVDELRPLVGDLRGGDIGLDPGGDESEAHHRDQQPDHQRHPARGRAIGITAGVAVLAVIGGAVAAALSDGPEAEPVIPGPLHTQEGVTQLLSEARSEFVGRDVDSLLIWGKYANLSHEDPADPGRRLTHSFRGEWEESRIDQFTRSGSFDIDAVDPDDVMAAIDAAPSALDIDAEAAVTSHVQVSPDPLGEPEFRVSASEGEDGDLGTATFGPDGELRGVEEP